MAAIVLVSVPLAIFAQPRNKVYQIGLLSGTAVSSPESVEAFRQGLREFGWFEGQNFSVIFRHGDEQAEHLAERAADLARMKVDVIVATVPVAVEAARRATTTIPIVMVFGPDPASAGVVSSLARPGGNVTGLTSLSADLAPKQLELLKAIVPGVSHVAVLWNPSNPWHKSALAQLEAAGSTLGIRLRRVVVRGPGELDSAFATMAKERVGGILSLSDPMTFTHRAKLAALALEYQLPMMNGLAEYTEAGGLASYWPNTREMFRNAAVYVHRILDGARPGDLPVEQPKTFDFVINLKTAKALRINIPAPVLARADTVIK
ncbi:MAG TPA: ABC transporter substrate-binding protein [Nitrospira sp.]|nr:ABC transporter substrate-binding protein [Nitrospira sp.]